MQEVLARARARLRRVLDVEPVVQGQLDELRQYAAQLEQAVQARDDFIATLGHELKNPLSPVLLQAELLLQEVRNDESTALSKEKLLPKLESCLLRLRRFLQTLDQLVDASRVGSGRIALSIAELDLAEVVRELCSAMDRDFALGQNDLRLMADIPVIGCWDRLRVEQIVRNLLVNAIRYGAGRPIEVAVQGDEQFARVSVRDYGPGIAAEDRERIFEKYEMGAAGHRAGGFGLGLWLVRSLSNAMAGTVEVHSEPGHGATFVVTLPRRRSHDDTSHHAH